MSVECNYTVNESLYTLSSYLGVLSVFFSCSLGATLGTAKLAVGVCSIGVLKPQLLLGYSENPMTMQKIDSIIDAWNDLVNEFMKMFFTPEIKRPEVLKNIVDVDANNFLTIIDGRYQEGKFFAGTDTTTISGFMNIHFVTSLIRNENSKGYEFIKGTLDGHANTIALAERMSEQLKDLLASRPKCSM